MKEMDCESIQNVIPLYIDNMLSETETDIVREHIKTCQACREELAFLERMIQETNKLPEIEVSAAFHDNVMEKIKTETGRKTGFVIPWKAATGFVAAAAVIALSVVSFLNLEHGTENRNPDAYMKTASPSVSAPAATQTADGKQNIPSAAVETTPASEEQTDNAVTEKKEPSLKKNPAQKETTAGQTAPAVEKKSKNNEIGKQTDTSASAPVQTEQNPATVWSRTAEEPAQGGEEHVPAVTAITEGHTPAASSADGHKPMARDVQVVSEDAQATDASEKDTASVKNGKAVKEPESAGSGGAASGGASSVKTLIATVTVSETAKAQAMEILSAYEKNVKGYQVGANYQTVLNHLSVLEGYSVSVSADGTVAANTIVLK